MFAFLEAFLLIEILSVTFSKREKLRAPADQLAKILESDHPSWKSEISN